MGHPVLVIMKDRRRFRIGKLVGSSDRSIQLTNAAGGQAGSTELTKLGAITIPWKKIHQVIREESR